MFSAYFISFLFKKIYEKISFNLVANYIITVIFCQVILAALLFISPSFKNLLFSMLSLSDLDKMLINETGEFRLIGFGSYFFGAGITNSFALILITIILKKRKFNFNKFFLYISVFFLILIIGIMMSRTTIIGGSISILIALHKSKFMKFKIGDKLIYLFKSILIFSILISSIIWILPSRLKDNLSLAMNFGFELAINYFESGELESASTDRLKEMYDVYPTSIKTYIIGDGHYIDPQNPESYYKHIDVGYLRLLYYFGIIGLLSYFVFQIVAIKLINDKLERKYVSLFTSSVLLLLILNLKGFTDIFFLFYLFYFVNLKSVDDNRKLIKL